MKTKNALYIKQYSNFILRLTLIWYNSFNKVHTVSNIGGAVMRKEEEDEMAMPQEQLSKHVSDAERKELIRRASAAINKKYDKALKMISKN